MGWLLLAILSQRLSSLVRSYYTKTAHLSPTSMFGIDRVARFLCNFDIDSVMYFAIDVSSLKVFGLGSPPLIGFNVDLSQMSLWGHVFYYIIAWLL